MPTRQCSEESPGSKLIAQTLFLGASVSSFNTSMGWGGQPSQLTVTLIEDNTKDACLLNNKLTAQFPTSLSVGSVNDGRLYEANDNNRDNDNRFPDDHYHTCIGDDCYINTKGEVFDSDSMDISSRIVPGKVYYKYKKFANSLANNNITNTDKCFISKYWYNPDPGFFGQPNRININNHYNNVWTNNNTNLNRGYDIIDTPVFFKMGNFTFGGLVQSWTKQTGQGGETYNVVINSMQSLLNSCHIIIGQYSGSVYSKLANSIPGGIDNSLYGGPRNYTKKVGVDYFGRLYEGNIPNVFNVYGFLESFGNGGFGGSNFTNQGISVNKIVDALKVLTSIKINQINSNILSSISEANLKTVFSPPFDTYAAKTAFSPFGRILAKCMQENDTYDPISVDFDRFGVIPPSKVHHDMSDSNRCQFLLDLNDIPRLPEDVRILGPVITITDLLNQIADISGFDYYADFSPVSADNEIYNIIKIKVIPRLSQPRYNEIENTIKSLQCNGYSISSQTIGKEKNETPARSLIIGAPVQRLYQAKSYRLAYTQSNYIFNPIDKTFIDYMQLGKIDNSFIRSISQNITKQFHHGKIRIPEAFDNHNPELSNIINPTYSGLYEHNQRIRNTITSLRFDDIDDDWSDKNQLGTKLVGKKTGNYDKSSIIKQEVLDQSTWGTTNVQQRFFPLYKDVICPFFGFEFDNELNINISAQNNSFQRIRPVWFDTWTGQIVVIIKTRELPKTSVDLENNIVGDLKPYFILTESEMRAAISGFDEFLVYSLSKTYKNDLIEMLRNAYILKTKEIYISEGLLEEQALKEARKKHDWYWGLMSNTIDQPGINIIGSFGQTVPQSKAAIDGTYSIDPLAIKDLQTLHAFVVKIGENYGKKYMVTAPYVSSYKDERFSDIALPTQAGTAYVFQGGGDLYYNYNPTNDGAWEEYGNIIDNCIAVGNKDWYNLTDDFGKIKPLLAYNANDSFDYVRHASCSGLKNKLQEFVNNHEANPFWSFNAWDIMHTHKTKICDDSDYIFSSIDYSNLSSENYSLVNVSGFDSISNELPDIYNQYNINAPTPFVDFIYSNIKSATPIDAFGKTLPSISGAGMRKLFVTASVEESFVYLDPENLKEPRILIESPGLTLNSSSEVYEKDPNLTIMSNIACEDLAIYLKSTNALSRDNNWIKYLLGQIYSTINNEGFLIGQSTNSANNSASHALLAPKAAHPFFAGIPLKSNIYTYGPWTNYPYIEYLNSSENIFPSGITVVQSETFPVSCINSGIIVSDGQAKKAIDNWILPTNVEIIDDYAPWNYGGSAFLDDIAINYARSKVNYQNVLESAQIDMPGLPIFNLSGKFAFSDLAVLPSSVSVTGIIFTDTKSNPPILPIMPTIASNPILDIYTSPTIVSQNIHYYTIALSTETNYTKGPIITNIQTNFNQGGVTTTYSFRTYTKKLSLFNKENSDRTKKITQDNFKRNKQLSNLSQKNSDSLIKQIKQLKELGVSSKDISSKDFKTKLFGWSPVKVLIAQAYPYSQPLTKTPNTVNTGLYSNPVVARRNDLATKYSIDYKNDIGNDSNRWISDVNYITNTGLSIPSLSDTLRYRTDVGLFEQKEVIAQIGNNYGLQSMMSLDGIFSPVSFYPTLGNSTFNFGLYEQKECPFCSGTKKIRANYEIFRHNGNPPNLLNMTGVYEMYCNKCTTGDNLLNIALKSNTTSKSSSSSQSLETLPPYIVTSGTDLSVLLEYGINKTNITTNISSNNSTNTDTGGEAGVSIPINMVSLQPIVVPYGEFKNPNIQNYSGVHPEGSGIHEDLSIGIFNSVTTPRTFFDRCRHSIEVVGRGAVNPRNINIVDGLKKYENYNNIDINADYYHKDARLSNVLKNRTGEARQFQNNQRFLGLRGPLVLHAWGYDLEGYPIPNASDEPYEIDSFNRPRRFKIKNKEGFPKEVKYGDLKIGDIFSFKVEINYVDRENPNSEGIGGVGPISITADSFHLVKDKILKSTEKLFDTTASILPVVDIPEDNKLAIVEKVEVKNSNKYIDNEESVTQYAFENDMGNGGGFLNTSDSMLSDRKIGYQGDIISKTQKWTQTGASQSSRPELGATNGKWSEKKKLKEFYLNWAERPDIWPVGPIDLRWDSDRKVWATKSDSSSSIYKMVYATLEEDLVKDDNYDETYPARAFLDDIEYSNEPLPDGFRRLIFIKDRGGYTAPRGAKLLCRYDTDTGFYEPVSKQAFVIGGVLTENARASIELSYIQGRKRGDTVPTMLVNFDNPFDFNIVSGNKGLFTFMNGKWTLTATKET